MKGNAAAEVISLFSRTYRSLGIELTITSTQTKYYFNNIRRLQDTKLQQLAAPWSDDLTVSPLTGTALVSLTTIIQASLTLLDKQGDAIIDTIPLGNWLRNQDTNITGPIKGFADLDVDWEKSYISFPNNTQPTADNGKVLYLCFDYCCQTEPN